MSAYARVLDELRENPRRWLVSGVAGFIGSALLESLLATGQEVVGLDNFATGKHENLEDVRRRVGADAWRRFAFREGDIRDLETCREATRGVDLVLHEAALGSVPRSIQDPIASHETNVNGTLNMLVAARDADVSRFVFASSSSVYGDDPHLPKVEDRTGRPLSPYAVTKAAGERYVDVFRLAYGLPVVSLRYFNVFGPRQDPEGPYAAVIPRWIAALVRHEAVQVFGDGETSRDFCYVANVVQANVLAATSGNPDLVGQSLNVAVGQRTTLNELFRALRERLADRVPGVESSEPRYLDFRAGDVRHSLADTSLAERLLAYRPTHTLGEGLDEAMEWYLASL